MQNDEFANLRSSVSRASALRVAQQGNPRLIDAASLGPPPPTPQRSNFWKAAWQVLPILVAIISTAMLAYVLLIGDPPKLFSQAQRAEPAKQPSAPPSTEGISTTKSEVEPRPQSLTTGELSEDLGPKLPMPRDDRLLTMIVSSMIALNQANRTGNYTVLREISAPAFQKMNSAEQLSKIFDKLRGQKLDLSPILLYPPKLFRRPEMNEEGVIRIAGFFPTAPERVNFDLMFQPVRGEWRLFGIAVQLSPAPPPPAQTPSEPAGEKAKGVSSAPAPTNAVGQEAKPKGASAEESDTPKNTKVEPGKPPALPAKKPSSGTVQNTQTSAPEDEVDVRDRIESPRASDASKPKPKPKPKTDWNPFER